MMKKIAFLLVVLIQTITFSQDYKFGKVSKEELERISQAMNLRRMGEPDDIASVVAFLVSTEGGWVNGQQIIVNGGGRI